MTQNLVKTRQNGVVSVKGSRCPTHLSASDREVGKDAVFLILVSGVGFEALHVKREGGGEDGDCKERGRRGGWGL